MNVDARVIYFDVETQRSAQEVVGGWKYPERFGLALAVAYDTQDRSYKNYTEATVANLIELLHTADLIVGFNHLRFDYKVLSAYTAADLQSLPNFDMHAQLWTDERLRVGLDKLGQYTLGRGKTADGEVPTLFRPQIGKVKTSFGPQIQQASNTLTRREGVCDKMPDAGFGIGDSLRVIQVNHFRPERPDLSFRSTTSWLFCGCPLPRSISQRAAPGAQCVPQRPQRKPYPSIQREMPRFQGVDASRLRAVLH